MQLVNARSDEMVLIPMCRKTLKVRLAQIIKKWASQCMKSECDVHLHQASQRTIKTNKKSPNIKQNLKSANLNQNFILRIEIQIFANISSVKEMQWAHDLHCHVNLLFDLHDKIQLIITFKKILNQYAFHTKINEFFQLHLIFKIAGAYLCYLWDLSNTWQISKYLIDILSVFRFFLSLIFIF